MSQNDQMTLMTSFLSLYARARRNPASSLSNTKISFSFLYAKVKPLPLPLLLPLLFGFLLVYWILSPSVFERVANVSSSNSIFTMLMSSL